MKPIATGAIALVLFVAVNFFTAASAQNNSGLRNGLPPTTMDSFVRNAAGNADQIYGDEGTYDIPPFFGYTYDHRINSGITGQRDLGITTGHGSKMPSGTGADEFITPGGEWSISGTNGGNPLATGGKIGFDYSDLQQTLINLNQELTAAENQLVQTQSDLQAAVAAAQQAGLTPAQQMAANIAVDDLRRQAAGLQNSITAMQTNLSGLNTKLAGLESTAERF